MPTRHLLALALMLTAACTAWARPQSIPVRTVTFHPLDAVERGFIYRNLGSQEISSERTRFQDGGSYIVYRFAFAKNSQASMRMRVTAQFQVDLSSDCKTFDTVAVYTKTSGDPLVVDLTPYTRRTGFVYVKVGDAKPDDGWGGKIHEVSITGQLRSVLVEPIGNIKPVYAPKPDMLYARLPPPARTIYHFAATDASVQETILFRTLQGLVNREKNQLMVADTWKMAPELLRLRWVDRVTEIPDADALFARFPKKDAVVYDPDLYGSENLAVMIGAMEGLVVAHPDLVEKYGLRVKVDLRGRWKSTIQGYKAVYAKYKTRFNRQTLVMAAPSKRPGLYDYAMAHRTFTFWIVGGTDANKKGADRWAEEDWFERTLSADFPVNIPILGYPQVEPSDGIGENRGVALFSRCAKFLVPADHMNNMSLLTAYPSARGRITMPPVQKRTLDRGRVYVSMVLSDGDNQCLWDGPTAFMFNYMRDMKAKGARDWSLSLTMGPNIVDLNPLAATLVNDYLQPQDSIGGAVSGVGYMYMSGYANNFGADRERVVKGYIDLTSTYLGYAGERWDWIMDYGGPGSKRLQDYAALRDCVALMGGYGQETTDPHRTAERVGQAVAFHSVNRVLEKDDLYREVKRMIDSGVRPLFLHVFAGNWQINPDRYYELATMLRKDGVEVVTPEVLADLYRQAEGK